jgi:hypothetical protein
VLDWEWQLLDGFGNEIEADAIVSNSAGLSQHNGTLVAIRAGQQWVRINSGELSASLTVNVAPNLLDHADVIQAAAEVWLNATVPIALFGWDAWNNSISVSKSQVHWTNTSAGLGLRNGSLIAQRGGNWTLTGEIIGREGEIVPFQLILSVLGDADGDGVSDADDAFPDDPLRWEQPPQSKTEEEGRQTEDTSLLLGISVVAAGAAAGLILRRRTNSEPSKKTLHATPDFKEWSDVEVQPEGLDDDILWEGQTAEDEHDSDDIDSGNS